MGGEGTHMDKDPLGTAQMDVGAGDIGLGARKGDTAVHGIQPRKTEGIDLLSEDLFQPEHTGGDKGQFHFGSFPL